VAAKPSKNQCNDFPEEKKKKNQKRGPNDVPEMGSRRGPNGIQKGVQQGVQIEGFTFCTNPQNGTFKTRRAKLSR